jgi:hypothetical protein
VGAVKGTASGKPLEVGGGGGGGGDNVVRVLSFKTLFFKDNPLTVRITANNNIH